MCTIINIKIGSCRTINYTGDIKYLGDTLAEEAQDDPELEQQILFAANEIGMAIRSRDKGKQMIDVLLNKNS